MDHKRYKENLENKKPTGLDGPLVLQLRKKLGYNLDTMQVQFNLPIMTCWWGASSGVGQVQINTGYLNTGI